MGRGRAKAKQIKVARRLKYNSGPSTDLTALERELRGMGRDDDYTAPPIPDDDDEVEDDPYAAYNEDDDGDYETWAAGQR